MRITTQEIKATIENLLHIEDLSCKSRKQDIVMARHLYCYFSRKHTLVCSEKIGELIKRDHSTVLHSVRNANELIETKSPVIYKKYTLIKERLEIFKTQNINHLKDQLKHHQEEVQRLQILIQQNEEQKKDIESRIKTELSQEAMELKDTLLNLSLVFDNLREELMQWVQTRSVKNLENSVKLINYDHITNFNTFSELNKAIR